MSTYVGPAGNLIRFERMSAEQIDVAERVRFDTTLGGVQKAQIAGTSPRSWQVGMAAAAPQDISHLSGLLEGLYGPPPWLYLGPWAQVNNLLAKATSMFLPGSWSGIGVMAGGPLLLADGSTPRYSVSTIGGVPITVATLPVVPGVPVTASAWASGDTEFSLSLVFLDAGGATLDTVTARTQATMAEPPRRGSVTAVPPAGSVNARFRILGARRAALPAFTWTKDLAPWAVGEGAPKVVARGLSKSVLLASRDKSYLRRLSMNFTLEEVGNA